MSRLGVVYVMKGWGSSELYKIGCTANLPRRYPSKRCLAAIVTLIEIPPGMNIYTAEEAVHRLFRHRWVAGETFDLTDGDLEQLKNFRFTTAESYGD